MEADSKLKIACESHRATISVIGAAGVPQAVVLKRFYVNAILEGIDDFTIECKQCPSMDSTFLGVLLGLALRLQRVPHGKFRTKNVSIPVLKQMAGMGLSQFLVGGKKA